MCALFYRGFEFPAHPQKTRERPQHCPADQPVSQGHSWHKGMGWGPLVEFQPNSCPLYPTTGHSLLSNELGCSTWFCHGHILCAAVTALETSGSAGLRWPWLLDIWRCPVGCLGCPGHWSKAGNPNLAQDFALCPSCASGNPGKPQGSFLLPNGSRSHIHPSGIWLSTGSLCLLPNVSRLHLPLQPFPALMGNR